MLRNFWRVLLCLVGSSVCCGALAAKAGVRVWLTTADLRHVLEEQARLQFDSTELPTATVIEIDPAKTYQTMLGLGASLEHSTCSNLFRLPSRERSRAIEQLVHPSRGIGMNLMRICMGTSDFTGGPWYSYDDMPPGTVDPELKHFSIEPDRGYILPCLKLARRSNPKLLFFASPWSPPGWMKTTGTMIGGELKREWYGVYAGYFVRFIRAYEAQGIPIYAVTVQNEPGVDRAKAKDPKWFYPSCHWTAQQERDFIRDYLGPAFRRAGLKTRIWCYDHNYNAEPKNDSDGLRHPRAILADAGAAALVDGVAFHHYEGQPSGMSQFHEEFPGKPVHLTEGSVFSIWGAYDLIERLRNWATSYNAWVAMLDEHGGPNNGPFPATTAILRLHSDTLRVEELFEFYCYGHFTKFIARGAARIESGTGTKDLDHVAFRNPDGSLVLVIANTTDQPSAFVVRSSRSRFGATLPPKAVMTCVWRER